MNDRCRSFKRILRKESEINRNMQTIIRQRADLTTQPESAEATVLTVTTSNIKLAIVNGRNLAGGCRTQIYPRTETTESCSNASTRSAKGRTHKQRLLREGSSRDTLQSGKVQGAKLLPRNWFNDRKLDYTDRDLFHSCQNCTRNNCKATSSTDQTKTLWQKSPVHRPELPQILRIAVSDIPAERKRAR